MGDIFGAGNGNREIVFCEACTQTGQGFLLHTHYGDDDEDE